MEFSAGLMTSVVCFKLIPEAFELGGTKLTFLGIFLGIVTVIILEGVLRKSSLVKNSGSTTKDIHNRSRLGHNGIGRYSRINKIRQVQKDPNLIQTGILTAIAIALHNLPEGFAVGSGFEASARLGLTLTMVILIHDIPEGMAMAIPMRVGGMKRLNTFLLTVLSGTPMGIGALVGAALGGVSRNSIAVSLGFAGGAMLYIVYGELVPQSKRIYSGRLSSLGNVFGIICGLFITLYD
jgi:ZIP family zinc transporter